MKDYGQASLRQIFGHIVKDAFFKFIFYTKYISCFYVFM